MPTRRPQSVQGAAVVVAVLHQALEAPIINGVQKPMKPGGKPSSPPPPPPILSVPAPTGPAARRRVGAARRRWWVGGDIPFTPGPPN
ncbi:hypothetical protein V498_08782 [Pseudogymnoascus sp. VKM F-4517 (FW-2822)]|nr:hypothetical protein V498_08782 [Pseudogymnoascus sp. VKM F-4517 (FW-2822)]